MLRSFIKMSALAALLGAGWHADAFTLLGPYAIKGGTVWQVPRIGYNLPGDIGGPMNVAAGEEYRWNVKTVYYTYDRPFLDFFGTRGMQEVEKAIKILNDLPAATDLNVDDYPMTTERVNYQAAALALIDLKSTALAMTIEEMGLASPERYVFCLRNRYVPGPNPFPVFYTVIRRNFDPITAAESPYINGHLWTYTDIIQLDPVRPWSYLFNSPVDPLDFGRFDPVASSFDQFSGFSYGSFFTGLTRDDIGAFKYMLQTANVNFETAITNATGTSPFVVVGGSTGGGWGIPPNTNVIGATNVFTNTLINPAYRFGVDKVTLVRVDPSGYDPITGLFFVPITNTFTEIVITNGVAVQQGVQRVVFFPDILYTAADLNTNAEPGLIPGNFVARSVTDNWVNDGTVVHAGPGVIEPPINIIFNNVGFINIERADSSDEFNVFGLDAVPIALYGAFDGTTNAPVIFSQGGNVTIQELEQIIFGVP